LDKDEVERPSKPSRRGNDKDGKKVIIDSRQNDEDVASAQISALQKSEGFSLITESLTITLTQTLEIAKEKYSPNQKPS